MKKILLSILVLLVLVSYFYKSPNFQQTTFGVSFSSNRAAQLGLNPKETYLDILNNLKVKNLRLTSYWSEIEASPGEYNFKDLDFQISEAEKRSGKVLLVLGVKQPGWPECFIPNWAKKLSLEERQQKALTFIQKVVERYRNNPVIDKWQVENEPLFDYGAGCDPMDENFLKKEIELVKDLDKRYIVITDSGELSFWTQTMKIGDIFGTTLYRKVNNPYFGDFVWPLSPGLYSLKSDLTRKFLAPKSKQTIISELQTEPWLSKPLAEIPVQKQVETFSLQDLKNNIEFAKKTGFSESYLWGVEWWYFMDKNGQKQYLEFAKTLF